MCNSNSGIGTGIGIPWILGPMELESELNRRLKSHGGIGIGIELNQAYVFKGGIGIRFESKGFARNRN